MLLRRDVFDWLIIEINRRMTCLLDFTGENNFQLKCPIAYFAQITIQIARRGINILYYGKKGVSSAKNLAVVDRSLGSLM